MKNRMRLAPRTGWMTNAWVAVPLYLTESRLRDLKEYMKSVGNFLSLTEQEFEKRIEATIAESGWQGEEKDAFYGIHEGGFDRLHNEFPRIVCSSSLITACSLFEGSLVDVCNDFERDSTLVKTSGWEQIKAKGIRKAAAFLAENFGLELATHKSWGSILDSYRVPAHDRRVSRRYRGEAGRTQRARGIEEEIRDWDFKSLHAIGFGQHLYYPLLHCTSNAIEISPVELNEGENGFVRDLSTFYDANKPFFAEREMYLLRNLSRGRGVGFFEAGNFHPDFILWPLVGKRQYITFVDPKGIRNLEGRSDPKIAFHKTIKELEARLGDPLVTLSSFIVANTPYQQVKWWSDGMSKDDFCACNVVFQQDDRDTYVSTIFDRITGVA